MATAADTAQSGITAYLTIPTATTPAWLDDTRLAYLSDKSGVPQIWLTDAKGRNHQQLTTFAERIGSLRASSTGERLVFGMDAGANEHEQLWTVTPGEEARALTSAPQTVHHLGPVSPDGTRLAFASNARDPRFFDVWTLDLESSGAAPRLLLATDELLMPVAWSPSGDQLLVERSNTNLDHDLLLIPAGGGAPELLTPHTGEATISVAAFAPAGDTIYLVSNQDRDFAALLRLDLATRQLSPVVETEWDVESLAVPSEGEWLAYGINDDGVSRITLRRLDSDDERPVTGLPMGVVDGLAWSPDGGQLAFRLHGPRDPSNIWVSGTDGAARQITEADLGPLSRDGFIAPETIRYQTFDDRAIPACWFRPATGAGPWPVVVDVHGGPESQRRPDFAPVTQWWLAHGFAVFAPNVRGSTGYGKAYSHLDDVERRMDSVADLAAAVDWLSAQDDVAPDRIAIYGRSYGGFMVLAAVTTYPDLWAAGVDIVGIANFETFLERTGPWRRQTRAAEYGDPERDAALLRAISPIYQADKIVCPMLLIHGRNDPRVPVQETEQIAARLRELGREVELIIFDDEGHQITKLANKITAYDAVAQFLTRTVMP
jgi:dipeptidyl aminopeptidase/acylaminoacyl peptidase